MKKPDSLAKACALGVVADLFEALGENNAETFVKQLLPTFQEYTKVWFWSIEGFKPELGKAKLRKSKSKSKMNFFAFSFCQL